MSEPIIHADKDYGFTLTRFSGGKERGRMYQLDAGDSHVELSAWQLTQLFCELLLLTRRGETI